MSSIGTSRSWSGSALLVALAAACGGADATAPGPTQGTSTTAASTGATTGASTGTTTSSSGGTSTGSSTGATTGTTGGGTTAGQLLFVGDFETGDLTQWAVVERCQPDRIVVYGTANAPAGAPPPRSGKYAALFHVLDTDVAPCTSSDNPRAQLDSATLFHPGDDRWEAWSAYVPTTHAAPHCGACSDPFFLFQADYGPPFDGSASIGWVFDFTSTPNHMRMDRGAQYNYDQPWVATLVTGQWVDFLAHKKFSNQDDGSGFVEAWVNGAPLTFTSCNCTKLVTQTMHSTQPTLEFHLASYRGVGLFDAFDTYYDEVRVGTTRDVVLPK